MGESLFARTGPAGQALSPFPPEEGEDLGERGGAPLQGKRGRGSFRKKKTTSYDFLRGTGDTDPMSPVPIEVKILFWCK